MHVLQVTQMHTQRHFFDNAYTHANIHIDNKQKHQNKQKVRKS